MASALKFCVEECLNELNCKTFADDSFAEAKYVCVVVQTCSKSAEIIAAASSSDTLDLIS